MQQTIYYRISSDNVSANNKKYGTKRINFVRQYIADARYAFRKGYVPKFRDKCRITIGLILEYLSALANDNLAIYRKLRDALKKH